MADGHIQMRPLPLSDKVIILLIATISIIFWQNFHPIDIAIHILAAETGWRIGDALD